MKRLLWVMIAMFLLQPVFSSIKSHEHFIESSNIEISLTAVDSILNGDLNTLYVKSNAVHQSEEISHGYQDMDCCQTADMSSCLIGCYFIPLTNQIELVDFKTASPLEVSIYWFSYRIAVESPPPRFIV